MKLFSVLFRQAYRCFTRNWVAIGFSLIAPIALVGVFVVLFGENRLVEFQIGVEGPADEATYALVEGLNRLPSLNAVFVHGDLDIAKERLRAKEIDAIVTVRRDGSVEGIDVVTMARPEVSQVVADLLVPSIVLAGVTQVGDGTVDGYDVRVIQHEVQDDVNEFEYLVPGIVVMGLMGLAFPTAGHNTALVRQDGLMRLYAVAPVPTIALVTSELAFLVLLAILQSALLILIAQSAFDGFELVAHRILPVGLVVIMGGASLIALGVLVGGCIPSTAVSINILSLLNVASLMLSGLFWPAVEVDWLRPFALVLPATWVCDALRQAITGMPGFAPLGTQLVVIAVGTLAIVGLTARLFRFEDVSP